MNKIVVTLWFDKRDVKNKLISLGLKNPSASDIEKVIFSAKNLACAWSSAFLQDLDKSELDNILNQEED